MTWWPYVQRVAGDATPSEIARRVGLTPSSVTRWQISTPKPETVAAFARAYDKPVLEAFTEAGFLTKAEADLTEASADVGDIPSEVLLAELKRRLKY